MKESKFKNFYYGSFKVWLGALAVCLVLVFGLGVTGAQAASLFMTPANGQLAIGQTLAVELRINSTEQGFNAAQGLIQFPNSVLEVKSLESGPSVSVFNFWLTGPSFSNASGQITFLGGTTDGVVGASIQILKITFVAKAAGQANIAISDAAITASDGSGTNILNTVGGAVFVVSPAVETPGLSTSTVGTTQPPAAAGPAPSSPAPSSPTPAVVIPEPVIPPKPITRTPTIAAQAPNLPEVSVPFYPDSNKWYNQVADFLVKWKLPNDIAGTSVVVNKESKFDPPSKSEGLYDAKAVKAISDGIWYAHVKLKNNIGWGPTSHYKIAIDTMPPLPFVVESVSGLTSDNPTPTLKFKTSDGLSGLANYLIRVDNGEELSTSDNSLVLPAQTPGQKRITVRAVDQAGNSRESVLTLEILPIASPSILTINKEAFANESDLSVSGTTLPGATINLLLKSSDGAVIAELKTAGDGQGNWGTQFNGPFKKGVYYLEAMAQDERGAQSLSVKSALFSIKEKPLLTIGGLAITQLWFFVALILILILAFAAGWLSYYLWRRQLSRKAVIAQRDLANIIIGLEKDLNKIIKVLMSQRSLESKMAEIKFSLSAMKKSLIKAQRYVVEGIKEISE